jgi:hypothetical protein
MQIIQIGLLAGIPVALVSALIMLMSGEHVAATLRTDPSFATMGDREIRWLWVGATVLACFGLGILASGVYAFVSAQWGWGPDLFLDMALVLAVVMSVLAIVLQTPLLIEKILINFAVAVGLGMLIPIAFA